MKLGKGRGPMKQNGKIPDWIVVCKVNPLTKFELSDPGPHVVFRKEWYRKTGKEVIEGRPLLHRLLGFKGRCKGCLQLIIMSYSKPKK